MKYDIISSDDPEVKLDGYRLPDGDPVLVIGDRYFRFSFGSQPYELTPIYLQAARLVDEIVKYKRQNDQ